MHALQTAFMHCRSMQGSSFCNLPGCTTPCAALLPLQELEHQLVAAAQEKTQVQSKFHELSIKHRQLIETSPQVGRTAGRQEGIL